MIKHKSEKEHENEVDLNELIKSDQDDSDEKSEVPQEVKDVFIALREYVEKHHYNAFFHVSFGAFDDDNEFISARYDSGRLSDVIMGPMEEILEELKQQLKQQ